MTMGIGLKCPEGVVTLTDSMAIHKDHLGIPTPLPGARKSSWLTPSRTNVIVSGVAHDGLFIARLEPDFVTAVEALWQDLLAYEQDYLGKLQPAVARYISGADDPNLQDFPHLLAAGGPPGPPQLACIKRSGARWAKESALYAVGAWTYSWLDPRGMMAHPIPPTLGGCVDLVSRWSREFMEFAYDGRTQEEHMTDGQIITVSFPLSLTVFDNEGNITEKEIAA